MEVRGLLKTIKSNEFKIKHMMKHDNYYNWTGQAEPTGNDLRHCTLDKSFEVYLLKILFWKARFIVGRFRIFFMKLQNGFCMELCQRIAVNFSSRMSRLTSNNQSMGYTKKNETIRNRGWHRHQHDFKITCNKFIWALWSWEPMWSLL